jgi:hypothetical protein
LTARRSAAEPRRQSFSTSLRIVTTRRPPTFTHGAGYDLLVRHDEVAVCRWADRAWNGVN